MLLEPLVSVIEAIKGRIATHGSALRQNETRTRAALIDPLLQALGWDSTDPGIVTPEYRVDVGWADYALLRAGNQPVAVVEAKRLGSVVENHLEQAVGYCIQQGIAYAGVTDGNHWQLYRTFEPVPLADKLVLDVTIVEAPAHESALKLLLLWRPNLASGQPVAANAPIFREVKVPPMETSSVMECPAVTDHAHQGAETLDSTGWTPLAQIRLNRGNGRNPAPIEIRFDLGQPESIGQWKEVHTSVAKWLVENGIMTAEHLPISGLGFVNSTPTGPQGKRYGVAHQVSEGIHLNTKMDAVNFVNNSLKLLSHFDVNPDTVELRFG